jgi:Ala-tRNA(Pro) deacylase
MPDRSEETTYQTLVAMLAEQGADFELIDHDPTGTTEVVSALRGHPAAAAAKCIMLVVKLDRKRRRYVLAVVPGDRRVDLDAVRRLYDARYVGFCDPPTAERLARAVSGAVLPFSLDEDVEVIADPGLVREPRIYFNAARLDRSVSLATEDYLRIAQPAVRVITGGESGEAWSA